MKRAWLLTAMVLIGMVGPATAAETDTSAPREPLAKTIAFERDSVQLMPGPFEVWSLAFSADDQFLAAAGGGSWADQIAGQARVWDFAKAKEVASYPTPRGLVTVALSPDGRRVALCSWSGDIWLHEVGGAELMHEKFSQPLRAVFSPDGKLLLAATERAQLRTWDGVTGERLEKEPFRGDMFPFLWVGFSPNGKYLVAAGGSNAKRGDIKLAAWSVATRQQLYKASADPERIYYAAISPDSQTLATSGENSAVLWDLPTGARRSQTEDTGGAVYRLEFSPDGLLLLTAGGNLHDGVISLWDASTGKEAGKLAGHELDVYAMAFNHDGKTLATAGADRSVRLWNIGTRQQTSILQEPVKRPDAGGAESTVAIMAIAYSPDGKNIATAGDDGKVSIYRLAPPELVRSWPAHEDATAALAWSPDGTTLATASYDKSVKFWNPANGELVRTLAGHAGWVVSLAFSGDGQSLASGSYDRTIRLWNVIDGSEHQKLAGHAATVRSVAFSHDGKRLASASADRTVRLWDVTSGREQVTFAGHDGAVRCVAFSADDRLLASGGEDKLIKIWNVESHELHGTLKKHADIVSAVGFAEQTLISASWDHTLRTWDADALLLRSKINVGPSEVVSLAITLDGQHMVSASADQSLALWKARNVEGQR